MKKIFTLLFVLVMANEGFSQTYYNWDFTTATTSTFPAGFVTWKLDGQTVNTNDFSSQGQALFNAAGWVLIPAAQNGGSGVAATTSDFNAAVQCDRWLVTPQINVPAATPNVVLEWNAASGDPNYPDSYEVLVSTTDSATSSFTTTLLGVTENGFNTAHTLPLAAYAGQTIRIAFRDTSTNAFLLFLNSISVVNLPSNAASVQDIEVYEHNYLTHPVTVSGYFLNTGFDTLNSFTLNYSVNGGAAVTTPVTALGLPSQQYGSYTHPTPFNPTTAGTYTIKVWLSGLNGSGSNSDTSSLTIFYYPKVAGLQKNVLLEEMTGAGCPYCSGGGLELRDIHNALPYVIPVAIHSGDIADLGTPSDLMQIPDGETVVSTYASGFPTAMADRLYSFDNQAVAMGAGNVGLTGGAYTGPSDLTTYNWDTLSVFRNIQATPVNVSLSALSYDTTSGSVTVTVNATFLNGLSQGTYNLNLYVVEDSLLTTGQGYDQDNGFYSSAGGQTTNYCELYSLPAVLTDNGQVGEYSQNHVLRTMAGGSWGSTGIIPSAPVQGTTYSNTYTTTLQSTWRPKYIKLVGLVQEGNSNPNLRTVLNAAEAPLVGGVLNGISETSQFNGISVYPNPASTMATVVLNSKENGLVTISILNAIGQVVAEPREVLLNAGSQSVNIPVSSLTSGLYFVKVTMNGEVSTLPLSITSK